jgi:hypothetical protein
VGAPEICVPSELLKNTTEFTTERLPPMSPTAEPGVAAFGSLSMFLATVEFSSRALPPATKSALPRTSRPQTEAAVSLQEKSALRTVTCPLAT